MINNAVIVATAAALAGCSASVADGIHAVDCASAAQSSDALILLSTNHYGVGGWNHINGLGSFATVSQEPSAYRVSAENFVPDSTCGDQKTWSVVLAKKTWDWDRNHANGIEAAMPVRDVTFADITDVTIVVRLNTEMTVLPTPEQLQDAYGSFLDPTELDSGLAAMEIILFGSSSEQPHMNASAMIMLDLNEVGDTWLRIRITREDLTFYTEANYERTAVTSADYQDHRVQGLRVNPETTSGLVARHFIGDDFDPLAQPELFKEMHLTFALIEVGWSGP